MCTYVVHKLKSGFSFSIKKMFMIFARAHQVLYETKAKSQLNQFYLLSRDACVYNMLCEPAVLLQMCNSYIDMVYMVCGKMYYYIEEIYNICTVGIASIYSPVLYHNTVDSVYSM